MSRFIARRTENFFSKKPDLLVWKRFACLSLYGQSTLLCLIIFQTCYSVAPVFLSHAITSDSKYSAIASVLIYLLFNFIPYPVMYLTSQFQTRWKITARRNVVNTISDALRSRPWLLGSKEKEQNFVALTTNNSQTIVDSTIDYIYGVTSTLASSITTLVIVTIYGDATLLIAYVISLTAILWIAAKTRPIQRRLSHARESAYNAAFGSIAASWPATVLDQKPFSEITARKIEKRWRRVWKISISATTFFQQVSMSQATVIWLPSTVAIVWILCNRDSSHVLAFLPFLPRVVELLLDISNLAMRLVAWEAQTGSLQWLSNQLTHAEGNEVFKKIKFEEISVHDHNQSLGNLRELGGMKFFSTQLKQPCRISLSAPNGSGKSVLLRQIKSILGDKCILINADLSQLATAVEMSTGQGKAYEILLAVEYARRHVGIAVMFDEWNANLDEENVIRITNIIDELAQTNPVLEVINHSRPAAPNPDRSSLAN